MSLLQWQQLNAQDTVFAAALANLLKRSRIPEATVTQKVEKIIRRVREGGDSALIRALTAEHRARTPRSHHPGIS